MDERGSLIYQDEENYISVDPETGEVLKHYGVSKTDGAPGRGSGRYPLGSGENPFQGIRAASLKTGAPLPENYKTPSNYNECLNNYRRVQALKEQGFSEQEIAKQFSVRNVPMSTTKFRSYYSQWNTTVKNEWAHQVSELYSTGKYTKTELAEKYGVSEGTIRNWLEGKATTRSATTDLAERLIDQTEKKPYLDVGKGVAQQLGVNPSRLQTAVDYLESTGEYKVISFDQPTVSDPSKKIHMKVLVRSDVPYREVRENQEKITSPSGFIFDGYKCVDLQPPKSFDSKRVAIRYDEDGGSPLDGLIEIRPGVPELYLGGNQYAQVRIAVDGTHYLKGMAVYSNTLPDGVDIRFNTSKSKDTPMMGPDKDHTVLKPMKLDQPENPFGAVTRPAVVDNPNCINLVNDDSDWDKWDRNLPTQLLAKQPTAVVKRQLDKTYAKSEAEFREICALTNPIVKKKLLDDFAGECDSKAVHMKAVPFENQKTHVLLPVPSLGDNEIYAPNYIPGTKVALVRFPFSGSFEMPVLTCVNNNEDAQVTVGQARNAVGVNAYNLKRMSGADCDGDTAIVIPIAGTGINPNTRPSKSLMEFDHMREYKAYPGMLKVGPKSLNTEDEKYDGFNKQQEMGIISNLIMDMTLYGASQDKVVRAVKYSMVVIDAEKHQLNWKQAKEDLHIAELHEEYQGKKRGGASTLISRAQGKVYYDDRKLVVSASNKQLTEQQRQDFLEGKKVYLPTGEKKHTKLYSENGKFTDKNGRHYDWVESDKPKQHEGKRLAEVDDAFTLTSTGDRATAHPTEVVYADYSNRMKALANAARKELLNTPRLQYNREARELYSEERNALLNKVQMAIAASPLERQAQLIAAKDMKAWLAANPGADRDKEKKQRTILLARARATVESKSREKLKIVLTDREWEAIQAGAISDSLLQEVLRFSDMDVVRQRATPRVGGRGLSVSQKTWARHMLENASENGYTPAQIAQQLGVSVSTMYAEIGA